MTTQNNSVAMLISINRLRQHHGQLESRPLPRQPDKPVFKLPIPTLHSSHIIRRTINLNFPLGMKTITTEIDIAATANSIEKMEEFNRQFEHRLIWLPW